MNIRGFVHGRWTDARVFFAKAKTLQQSVGPAALPRTTWGESLVNPRQFYLDCFRYFHRRLPASIQAHRRYFRRRKRGFGEDAFHTMWFLLMREFQPRSFLEIGVYRGQTLSLVALLARDQGFACEVYGISPFSNAGDSVSRYPQEVDYHSDTLKNFEYFSLPPPHLLRAFSTDAIAQELIRSRQWDVIYIDGNHDYEVAKADWAICAANVRPGGLIVMDDSGLSSVYEPPGFATRGHPGPSKVAQEVAPEAFVEILQVGHNRVFQKRCQDDEDRAIND